MKILKRAEWKHEFTCRGCKSTLLAEADDVRVGDFGSCGDYDTEFYVECPICETCHRFGGWYTDKLPADVKKMASERRKQKE